MNIDMGSMLPYLSWFWEGTKVTLTISFITVVLGCIIGFVATLARRSRFKLLNWISSAYTQVIRGTPILLQIYLWTGGLPQIGIKIPDVMGISRSGLYITVVLALAINSGAYISEIFRSGLNSVDKGQAEAARSLGLNAKQTMRFVILPQAIKTILPALGNEFIMMIKESSMVSVVGLGDVMYQQKILQGATYKIFEPLIMIGIIYFLLTSILTFGLGILERRLNRDAKN
jgi:amine acid ABC transporter, permease protein, 3-TM region, His/Glu/Gln/Arg/opine family